MLFSLAVDKAPSPSERLILSRQRGPVQQQWQRQKRRRFICFRDRSSSCFPHLHFPLFARFRFSPQNSLLCELNISDFCFPRGYAFAGFPLCCPLINMRLFFCTLKCEIRVRSRAALRGKVCLS